jgi:uncharacterized membrane protein YiaA
MDVRERRVDTARILGATALVVGFLITVVGLVTDGIPAKGYVFAGMLVFVGTGLRVEAAITSHR